MQVYKQVSQYDTRLVYTCPNYQGFENQPCPTSNRNVVETANPNTHKFDVFLRLQDVTVSDSGIYIVRVENTDPASRGSTYIEKRINLSVKGKLL